ncbi:unnamed protein product [Thelazia callipaeda]|uniref:Phage protein n=1 Tax=Thelazia callipaeda TaxID=103827 RepID=A0A0N5DAK8_THECL|nr:unnamed protein product [Thelazia callipaeda]
MALLRSPDVMLQFWLRVGKIDNTGGTGFCEEDDEEIFVLDYEMLCKLIQEIEKITAVACKLERLRLK